MTKASPIPVCALIGVGPGLGLSLARKFGQERCKMALVARGADALTGNVATLEDGGVTAHAFPADVTDQASLDRAFTKIGDSLGPPTILLYNAAVVTTLPSRELAVDTFLRDLAVNTVGTLASVQCALPAMKAAGGGTILFSSAGVGIEPDPSWASYSATKAALRNLAFSIAAELGNDNIHVAAITIAGHIDAGTKLDPDRIADEYWRLHTQKTGDWEGEVVIR